MGARLIQYKESLQALSLLSFDWCYLIYQIVGAERGTGGKDSHPGITAQPRWTHRGRPALPDSLGKLPDDPQMGEFLNAPQGIRVSAF